MKGPITESRALALALALALAAPVDAAAQFAGADGAAPRPYPSSPDEPRLTNLRMLTDIGENAEAYFSSDGRRLIFQATRPGESACDQIYIMDVDGTNRRRVSTGEGKTTCGYFFPADGRIVFSSTHLHGPECPPRPDYSRGYVWPLDDYDIFTADPDGGRLRRLTAAPGYDAEATVSPDGSRIVFTSVRDGDLEVYVMDADGSNVRRLTHEPGYDGGAFFSADGRRIVYRAHHPGTPESLAHYRALLADGLVRPTQLDIWVMDADGSDKRRVTDNGAANFAPFFHPDGERIIFSSNLHDPDSRNFDLYLVGVDGTGLERVTTHGDFDGFPMFTRDGTKLIFASNRGARREGDTNIFIADWVERPGFAFGSEEPRRSCPDPPADIAGSAGAIVGYLAADALEGRLAGSGGEQCAASFIAREFARLGLRPGGADGYLQEVPLAGQLNPHAPMGTGVNVVAVLPGADPALADEPVIIGAHHDHLGRGPFGSLAADSREVHNGADDNASGVAALLVAARELAGGPRTDRAIVFVTFTGEELGLLGSAHFAANPTIPLDGARAMINLDMVGRLEDDPLVVSGTGTAEEWGRILEQARRPDDPVIQQDPDGYGPSDHTSFYGRDIPVLHFFTNVHADYHRPSDDAGLIDVPGIERIGRMVARIARGIADDGQRLTLVRGAGTPPHARSGGGYGAYLGSIPDFSPADFGVRLTGVRAGSPADRAGIRAGDVIVRLGGMEIADLYALTDALRAHRAGDRVSIAVVRDGQEIVVEAVLGERGGS